MPGLKSGGPWFNSCFGHCFVFQSYQIRIATEKRIASSLRPPGPSRKSTIDTSWGTLSQRLSRLTLIAIRKKKAVLPVYFQFRSTDRMSIDKMNVNVCAFPFLSL